MLKFSFFFGLQKKGYQFSIFSHLKLQRFVFVELVFFADYPVGT